MVSRGFLFEPLDMAPFAFKTSPHSAEATLPAPGSPTCLRWPFPRPRSASGCPESGALRKALRDEDRRGLRGRGSERKGRALDALSEVSMDSEALKVSIDGCRWMYDGDKF